MFNYQKIHVTNLKHVLNTNNCVLDASDMGTGKTYTAIQTCKELGYKPLIICPKSVISIWKNVSKKLNHDVFFIVNYETFIMCKYYDTNNNRVDCPYITQNINFKNNQSDLDDKYTRYVFDLPKDDKIMIIFDEAHRANNIYTHIGQLLISAKLSGNKIMMLSATIADKPDKFKLFLWVLNFVDTKLGFVESIRTILKWYSRDTHNIMDRVYKMLYPNKASRMDIKLLGDTFPKTQILAESYYMGEKRTNEIQKQYDIVAECLNDLKNKIKNNGDKEKNHLVMMLRAHQKIELLKIPTFLELIEDFVQQKYSVAVFVNYRETLNNLNKIINNKYKTSVVNGNQTEHERTNNIEMFNNNTHKIILLNIKAGSVGISLHDTRGNHPRVSLISPTYNSIDFVQALGRIHRAGSKSNSLQRIVFCTGTVEEKIAEALKHKLLNINSINTGNMETILNDVSSILSSKNL